MTHSLGTDEKNRCLSQTSDLSLKHGSVVVDFSVSTWINAMPYLFISIDVPIWTIYLAQHYFRFVCENIQSEIKIYISRQSKVDSLPPVGEPHPIH